MPATLERLTPRGAPASAPPSGGIASEAVDRYNRLQAELEGQG